MLLYLTIAILHSVALGFNMSNETYPSNHSTHASLSKNDIIGMVVGPLLLLTIVAGFLLVAYCRKASLDPPGMRERIVDMNPRQPIHGVMSRHQGNFAPPAPPYNPSPALIVAQQTAQGESLPPYTTRHL